MKKSLVLAMAMALGVTASAYAANPFSDVPAGHWAYDSLAKLADTGVIDGYPDGTFKGDETITRYEAAQITARAMAKGANVDKLAAEFASELEALGVKVAALEKKADNFKIAGYVRYHYAAQSGDLADADIAKNASRLRTRLTFKGQVNDDWSFTGMLAQDAKELQGATDDESVQMQRAYVNGKIGGVAVQAGRYNLTLGDGNLYDNRANGIEASYGKAVKVTARYGKATYINTPDTAAGWQFDDEGEPEYVEAVAGKDYKYAGAEVAAKLGIVNADAQYTKFNNSNGGDSNTIWSLQAGLPVAKDLKLDAIYLKSNKDDNNKGVVATLAYKGASAAKAGSWGVYAKYYNQGKETYLAHTMNGQAGYLATKVEKSEGFKGFMVGAKYAVAKNMVAGVEYYNLKSKGDNDKSANTLWTELVFTF